MHPMLFEVGDFPVGTYALMALLALVAGVWTFAWLGHRAGFDRTAFVEMGLWAFIVAIVSSKLFGALVDADLSDLKRSLLRVLRFSGHFYVGFGAGVAYLVWALRRHRVPLARGLDLLAPSLALAHAIGRIGCFLAGCCWGKACSLPWAVTFTSQQAHQITGVPLHRPLHPTQIYELVVELTIFGALLWRELKRPGWPGSTFLLYVFAYGTARFFLEFVRADPRGQVGGVLSTSQALALASLVGGGIAWLVLSGRARRGATSSG